jgi:transglutaminase-like putative cysteine protease
MLPRAVFAWCAAAAIAALLPLGLQLQGWLGPILILLGLLGTLAGLRGAHIPAWLRLLLTLGVAGLVLYIYGFKFGRDTGAGLLATMLALKLLETHRLRDARALLSFSLFGIMAAFLLDQSPTTLVLALLAAVLVLSALARASEMESGTPADAPGLPARLRATGLLMLLSLPLAVAGFLLFPRLAQPLWGLPDNAGEARTGLSDSMAPGDISSLFIDDSPILRAQFFGARPANADLYWRGPVFNEFDGRRWTVSPWFSQLQPAPRDPTDEALDYELIQEPTDRRWVMGLDVPLQPPGSEADPELRLNRDRSLIARRPLLQVSRHRLRSVPGIAFDTRMPVDLQRRFTALPEGFNPRTAALIADWQQRGLDTDQVVREALQLFNREFSYSLTPPTLGRHSVDEFVFDTREGYCEHFSSSFTVMLRMAGVPARVVTGYQGGFYNALGDYIVVRQSDAHAWSEVWIDGRGWVRIDPTAAVAAERILSGGEQASDRRSGWIGALGPLLDAADWLRHGWNSAVLGFNSARQRSLLLSLGIDANDWRQLGLALLGGLAIALGLTLWLVMRGAPKASDPLVAAYLRFCARLARSGPARAPHEPALRYAERAAAALPECADTLRELSAGYTHQRYGADRDPAARASLIRALRGFRVSRTRR